jgi:hypothetical protein
MIPYMTSPNKPRFFRLEILFRDEAQRDMLRRAATAAGAHGFSEWARLVLVEAAHRVLGTSPK